jgi:glycosyltransferase involved in cell wall biosynthesis
VTSRVYLTGRDEVGWATDDDHRLVSQAIASFTTVVPNAAQADVIHSVNWRALLSVDARCLAERPVLAHIPHDVRHLLAQPRYLEIAPRVNRWLVPSRRALAMAAQLGLPHAYVPYAIDTRLFRPLGAEARARLRIQHGLPADSFLVGSFQRDTEGVDLRTPKYVKGPDVFAEIVRIAARHVPQLHVVLGGPRRGWLKRRLTTHGVPWTHCGVQLDGDDLRQNTLDHATMNELYNLLDVYVVSSRMEGGPKAVLECAACGTPVLSPDVGQAPDLLGPEQIYLDVVDGAEKLLAHAREPAALDQAMKRTAERLAPHSIEAVGLALRGVYEGLDRAPKGATSLRELRPGGRLRSRRLSIYFKVRPPPWGGGNQFLGALSQALRVKHWRVRHGLGIRPSAVLLNSFHGDQGRVSKAHARAGFKVIHRIDGPTVLIRDRDRELDEKIFELNRRIADASVFQSWWSLQATLALGFRPINPVLITNASDPGVFRRREHRLRPGQKVRLISTSWSDNPRKGGATYRWLDQNLDFERFEYTFVGRVKESFDNIRIQPPVGSEELARLLDAHDIYITASDNDPCSNSLIEALSCGLPALYLNRGGHPEITGFGGLGFDTAEQIPQRLATLVAEYAAFAAVVQVPSIGEVAELYALTVQTVTGHANSGLPGLARRLVQLRDRARALWSR